MSRVQEQISERLRAEQLAALMRHFPGVMFANACNALVFVVANWETGKRPYAFAWASVIWLIVSLIVLRQWRRRSNVTSVSSRRVRGIQRLLIYALGLGLAWAALPLLFFSDASLGGKLLIVCLASGMLGGGVFVMASVPAAAMAFSGPIAMGAFVALLRVGDVEHLLMATVLVGYSVVLFLGSFNYARNLKDLIATQVSAEEKASVSAKNLGAMAEMAAGLAHEISQPLAAATAFVQSAQRLLTTPVDQRPYAVEKPLQDAVMQLGNARDIIAHLRNSIANRKAEKELVGLHALILSVIEANRQRQEQLQARIDVDFTASSDLVLANRVEMRQIFTNLISNAFDAMEASAERALVISSYAIDENFIRVDVADTGTGISPAISTKLFEPLISTKAKGLGVGLSITRAIVEDHRGKIWAEPNPSGGTIFALVLPTVDPSRGT